MKRSNRRAHNFPESVQHSLNMYALAAGAAGVGLLALVQPANAKIVYTPTNVKLQGPFPLDLNHDGITDFVLFPYGFHTSTGGGALLVCHAPFNNGTRIVCASSTFDTNHLNAVRVTESGFAEALRAGAKIQNGFRFGGTNKSVVMGEITFPTFTSKHERWAGPWVNSGKGVKNHYLGLKFKIKGLFHFGWARLTVTTTTSGSFTATLTGYAYETIVRRGIIAGQTQETENVSPDTRPAAASRTSPAPRVADLGVLALGSPGLSIWRREEIHQSGNSHDLHPGD